jgi:hypothetical protein
VSNDVAAQVEAAKKKIQAAIEKTVRLTALSIFKEVVMNTPVGNPSLWQHPAPPGYAGGSARLSWNMDVDHIDVSITHAETEVANSYDGSEKALAAIARYKLGSTIHISNNVPYILPLNNGHSTQAPINFIEAAVQVGTRRGKEIGNQL